MNSFTLMSGTSTAGRNTSNMRLDNNMLWIIIAAIHRDRFSIDCYHFEPLYLILIWAAASWKSCVDWKIGLFYHNVWMKEGLLLFTVMCLESRQEECFVAMLKIKYYYSWRLIVALYGKRTMYLCVCMSMCPEGVDSFYLSLTI